jgi:hypothetical protein
MYFLRTSNKQEIDLIVDDRVNPYFAEIKLTSTFKFDMIKNIESLISKGLKGYLIYRGESSDFKKINLINYKQFLELKSL